MSFPFPRPFPGPSAMVSYSVLSLFMSGEQGVWYDPSDFTTMFQDSAGTTPVTAVEQPVGLILDKSKGLTLGSELVTNGDFSGGTTGWTGGSGATISIVSGGLLVDDPTSAGFANQAITTIANRYYKITAQFVAVTAAANPNLWVGTTNLTSNLLSAVLPIGTTGTITGYFLATGTTSYLSIGYIGTGQNVTIDNVSVRELPGNHASQSTSASRPVLSARVNLLTYSEQFDNAVWTKQNGAISANAETAPNGTLTADKFTPTAAASTDHRVITGVITTTGGYTLALYVKPAGYSKFGFRNGAVGEHATFNLSGAGAVIEQNSCTASITAEPNGWYKVQIVNTSASTRCDFWALNDAYTSGNPGAYSYTGDGTSGIYIWGADLRVTNVGVGLPAYQRVAAATDYDTSNFPLYLKFDGVDDSLATGTIDFSATDKMSVFAGVRKLSDAAGGEIVSLGDITSVNGSFELRGPRAAAPNYMFGSRGTSFADANIASGYSAPITNVVTGIADISVDLCALRINGTVVASPTTDQGTGNYSSGVVFVGRLGGSSLPYNGNLYSLLVRGALSTDAQIASTETYVNSKTGAY